MKSVEVEPTTGRDIMRRQCKPRKKGKRNVSGYSTNLIYATYRDNGGIGLVYRRRDSKDERIGMKRETCAISRPQFAGHIHNGCLHRRWK
jgi:hypothetical protein